MRARVRCADAELGGSAVHVANGRDPSEVGPALRGCTAHGLGVPVHRAAPRTARRGIRRRRAVSWRRGNRPRRGGRSSGGDGGEERSCAQGAVMALRRFGASALRRFGASALRRFGASALRRFGASALRRFGASALRRFGASALRRFGAISGCRSRRCRIFHEPHSPAAPLPWRSSESPVATMAAPLAGKIVHDRNCIVQVTICTKRIILVMK